MILKDEESKKLFQEKAAGLEYQFAVTWANEMEKAIFESLVKVAIDASFVAEKKLGEKGLFEKGAKLLSGHWSLAPAFDAWYGELEKRAKQDGR